MTASPKSSLGLQRTATTELLSSAVPLLPVHSGWPWWKWWPLGPLVKYNYLVGFLASYNISKPTFSLLSASLFLLLFCYMKNQAPRLHSTLIITFSKLLRATLTASLSHSLWLLTGVKCHVPTKYTQINKSSFFQPYILALLVKYFQNSSLVVMHLLLLVHASWFMKLLE